MPSGRKPAHRELGDGAENSRLRHRFSVLEWVGVRPQSRLKRLPSEAELIRTVEDEKGVV